MVATTGIILVLTDTVMNLTIWPLRYPVPQQAFAQERNSEQLLCTASRLSKIVSMKVVFVSRLVIFRNDTHFSTSTTECQEG